MLNLKEKYFGKKCIARLFEVLSYIVLSFCIYFVIFSSVVGIFTILSIQKSNAVIHFGVISLLFIIFIITQLMSTSKGFLKKAKVVMLMDAIRNFLKLLILFLLISLSLQFYVFAIFGTKNLLDFKLYLIASLTSIVVMTLSYSFKNSIMKMSYGVRVLRFMRYVFYFFILIPICFLTILVYQVINF